MYLSFKFGLNYYFALYSLRKISYYRTFFGVSAKVGYVIMYTYTTIKKNCYDLNHKHYMRVRYKQLHSGMSLLLYENIKEQIL